jgi:hypothetical protein
MAAAGIAMVCGIQNTVIRAPGLLFLSHASKKQHFIAVQYWFSLCPFPLDLPLS